MLRVFVGYDPREIAAYQVCVSSMVRRSSARLDVAPLMLCHLQAAGLYRRPIGIRNGLMWDVPSNAAMSTEFANSRFLVPFLTSGWALFCDADFLWRADVTELFALANPKYAVMCVQHDYKPAESVKMDGQVQAAYPRKNWSSLMLINCAHPAHKALTLERFNTWAGRDLHALCWLRDNEIGLLPERWNWLEGHSSAAWDPKAVHFTRGCPNMPGYETVPYADEWRAELASI